MLPVPGSVIPCPSGSWKLLGVAFMSSRYKKDDLCRGTTLDKKGVSEEFPAWIWLLSQILIYFQSGGLSLTHPLWPSIFDLGNLLHSAFCSTDRGLVIPPPLDYKLLKDRMVSLSFLILIYTLYRPPPSFPFLCWRWNPGPGKFWATSTELHLQTLAESKTSCLRNKQMNKKYVFRHFWL